jgi:type I restriction enzyme S subunit
VSVRLRHVAAINPPTPEFELLPDTAELPFFPLEAVWPGDRLVTTRRQSKAAVSSGYTRFREGDILLPKITPTFQADRTVIANGLEGGVGAGTTELHVVRAGPDADVRYLRYLLSSKNFLDEGEASMIGVAGQKRVPDDCLRDLAVPVVDLRRQRAIADSLDRETARIDALIEKKQNLLILLERRLIQLAYSLTVAKGGTIPLRRLVRQVKTGATPPASDFDRLRDGDRPWYSPGDVRSWMVLDTPSRCLNADAFDEGWVPAFPANSTLVVGIGATAGRVAHLGHLASGNQQMTCLVPGPQILPRFLSWQLLARAEELRATAPFTTLPILNNDFLRAIPLFVPTIEKQAAIVGDLDELADKLQKVSQLLGRQITLLQEHRQALITAAVTGELEVPGVAA